MLNEQQQKACALIVDWYLNRTQEKQIFTLAGYAGTGKTFLVNYIIDEDLEIPRNKVAYVTPTGKAASVLIQRGSDAMTIHRLIYNAVEVEYDNTVNGKSVKSKRIEFVKKPEIPNYKLIIVDETSMVEEKIMKDLLSFGIPILCCGDSGQLPPIFKNNGLLEHPDFTLTEIVRQSSDNAIVQVATAARNAVPLKFGNINNEVIVSCTNNLMKEQYKNLLLKSDQIICGTNITRRKINDEVRLFKGIDSSRKYPTEGEKIICTVNNWELYLDDEKKYNLVNGTIGYCHNFRIINPEEHIGMIDFEPDFLPGTILKNILIDIGIFENYQYTFDMHQRAYIMPDNSIVLKENFRREDDETIEEFKSRVFENVLAGRKAVDDVQVNRFEFAYAISCHKSQGSEWNKVLLFDESSIFGSDANRWLYTGITRSKKKLVILK